MRTIKKRTCSTIRNKQDFFTLDVRALELIKMYDVESLDLSPVNVAKLFEKEYDTYLKYYIDKDYKIVYNKKDNELYFVSGKNSVMLDVKTEQLNDIAMYSMRNGIMNTMLSKSRQDKRQLQLELI